MDTAILTLSFATTTVVAVCIVLAFSMPIDGVLDGILSGALAQAWSRYVKFALFATSFTGGLRLNDLGVLASQRTTGAPSALGVNQGMLEVFHSITASLAAASWTLLIFFGAALAIHVALRVSETFKTAQPRPGERIERTHSGISSGRL